VTEPGVALSIRRPGTLQIRAGWSTSKEFAFLNQVKPIDATLRMAFRLGFVYFPKKRYSFSWQNGLRYSSNLTDTGTFKGVNTNTSTLNYSTNVGFNYRLSRGSLVLGAGTNGELYRDDRGGRRRNDNFSYVNLNAAISHIFTPRLTGALGYSYRARLREGRSYDGSDSRRYRDERDQTIYVRMSYKAPRTTIGATVGIEGISWKNGGSNIGVPFSIRVGYQLTSKDNIGARYSSSLVQNDGNRNQRGRSVTRDTLSAHWSHRISLRTSFNTAVAYSATNPLRGALSSAWDETQRFNYHASLRRQIYKNKIAAELRYRFQYNVNKNNDGKNKQDWPVHTIYLRLISYFGGGGA